MGKEHLFDWTGAMWCSMIALVVYSATCLPVSAGDKVSPPRTEASTLTIHVPIPIPAFADLYGGIHGDFASHGNADREWVPLGGGTGFLKYRIWPGEQGFKTIGGRLYSQATFAFGVEYAKRLDGSLKKIAECGQRDQTAATGRLFVHLAITFAQNRGYSILPASTVVAIEPTGSCLLSEQSGDAAPLMAQVYRNELQRILPPVDRKAAGLVTLKPAVARIWEELEEPMLLDEAQALWLVVNPESIGSAGVSTLSDAPSAGFMVTARPAVVRGPKPASRHLPLPAPQDRFQDGGFHVAFALQVPMEEANQRLREAVVGQEWSLAVGRIKIVGATLYPLSNQLGVELTLRGLFPLTLRLKGTPVYDETTERIVFRDVDYTIKERTPATDLAEEWLHETLREELARRLVVPIREELELMRKAIEIGLNRDLTGGRLRGTVQQLSLKELAVQTDSLAATFKTHGALRYEAHADRRAP
ncbi:MAG: DUF4403 family protein [Nitrospira sp.]|nr:DUF4403 family protein [Nitrospira sp.]